MTVLVVKGGEAWYPEILLGLEDGEVLQLDSRGINWRDVGDGLSQAGRRYGKNIFLLWYGWQGIGRTDETWERLDRILTDLVGSAGGNHPSGRLLRPPGARTTVQERQDAGGSAAVATLVDDKPSDDVESDAATADAPVPNRGSGWSGFSPSWMRLSVSRPSRNGCGP